MTQILTKFYLRHLRNLRGGRASNSAVKVLRRLPGRLDFQENQKADFESLAYLRRPFSKEAVKVKNCFKTAGQFQERDYKEGTVFGKKNFFKIFLSKHSTL